MCPECTPFAGRCLTMMYRYPISRDVRRTLDCYSNCLVSEPLGFWNHLPCPRRDWIREITLKVEVYWWTWWTCRWQYLLFFVLEDLWLWMPPWRGLRDFDLITGNDYTTLLFSYLFIFFQQFTPNGQEGYPEPSEEGFTPWVCAKWDWPLHTFFGILPQGSWETTLLTSPGWKTKPTKADKKKKFQLIGPTRYQEISPFY